MKILLILATLLIAGGAQAQITLGPIAVGDTFTDTNVAPGGTCVASGTGTTPNTTCTYGGLWQVHKSILNAIVSQLCTCFPGNTGPTGAAGTNGTNGATGATGPTGAAGNGIRVYDDVGGAVANTAVLAASAFYWIAARSSYWKADQYTGDITPDYGQAYYANSSCTGSAVTNSGTPTALAFTVESSVQFVNWYGVARPATSTPPTACWSWSAGTCQSSGCGAGPWRPVDVYASLPTALHSGPLTIAP